MSVIGPRVQEIFTVCLQQREQWPQVFNFLIKCMPGKVAEQLRQPSRSNTPIHSKTSVLAGISVKDQQALCAYQDKRGCVAQRMLAERQKMLAERQHMLAEGQASRNTLSHDMQKALEEQADIRDALDLKAMLLVRPCQA